MERWRSQAEAERRLASAKRDAPPAVRPTSAKRSRPGLISSDVRVLAALAIFPLLCSRVSLT